MKTTLSPVQAYNGIPLLFPTSIHDWGGVEVVYFFVLAIFMDLTA